MALKILDFPNNILLEGPSCWFCREKWPYYYYRTLKVLVQKKTRMTERKKPHHGSVLLNMALVATAKKQWVMILISRSKRLPKRETQFFPTCAWRTILREGKPVTESIEESAKSSASEETKRLYDSLVTFSCFYTLSLWVNFFLSYKHLIFKAAVQLLFYVINICLLLVNLKKAARSAFKFV